VTNRIITAMLSLLMCAMLFCSCYNAEKPTVTKEPSTVIADEAKTSESYTTVCEGKGYVVLDIGSQKDGNYLYRIIDGNGSIVREEKTFRDPRVTKVNDSLIGLMVSYGTGFSTEKTFYYDTETEQMSKDFNCVLTETEEIVVCGDRDRLHFYGIFDDSFHQEITDFKYPIAQIGDIPFQKVELSEEENSITVTYLTGVYDPKKGLYPHSVTESISIDF